MEITVNHELISNLDKIHMDISEMAIARLGTDWHAEGIRSPFTRVYMITGGCGEVRYGEKKVKLEKGNIYIIPAGMTFSYQCEDYLEKIYFHVSVLLPNHYDMFSGISECIIFSDREKIIDGMLQRLRENKPSSVLAIKQALYDILLKCILTKSNNDEKIASYSDVVCKTQEYIDKNLSAALTVSQIAKTLFISASKLQKIFKKEMGVSVGRYIDDRLMYTAERELREGERSINEISAELGFCDQFYFSRRFSKAYGMPPLKYRKMFAL